MFYPLLLSTTTLICKLTGMANINSASGLRFSPVKPPGCLRKVQCWNWLSSVIISATNILQLGLSERLVFPEFPKYHASNSFIFSFENLSDSETQINYSRLLMFLFYSWKKDHAMMYRNYFVNRQKQYHYDT